MSIGTLVTSFGYLAVFALVGLESLGVPLPGETALIIACVYAANTHRLSPWLIFAVACTGAIAGDNIGYFLGDQGGYRLLKRVGEHGVRFWAGRWRTWHPVDERKLKIARYLFDRQGAKVVFFGRFVSVLRTYAAFLAGVNKMRWRRFVVANAAGGILWAGIYTLVASVAGAALQRASATISLVLGGVAAVVIVAVIVLVRRKISTLAARAEEAYPGPIS